MSLNAVVYEHALNDHTRVCLRLEALFLRLKSCQKKSQNFDHYFALQTLLHLINLMDRPDLKNKLMTALQQHSAHMQQWLGNPKVNQDTLKHLLDQLQEHCAQLKTSTHLPGFELSQHPFIKTVRQHASHPGGIASDNLPYYQFWLSHQSQAHDLIDQWILMLTPLMQTVALFLSLIRQSKDMTLQKTNNGLYKQPLNSEQEHTLIRLELHDAIYPEFSVGKHQLAVYFFKPILNGHNFDSHIANNDITFQLALC